ncbi:MAG TPA: DapH/DapD/GlmU-related protein [Methanocellaceae archaeon]|jgi:acetyltransferase-like isoleucine patch superfamily enzyme
MYSEGVEKISQSQCLALNGSRIHESCKVYGITTIGRNCTILENVTLGYPSVSEINEAASRGVSIDDIPFAGTKLGDDATIRPNSTFYSAVTIGNGLRTGHNALVRERTVVGDNVLIGTNVVIDGECRIGSHVSIQSNVYIPTNTIIEDNVFLGPCSVLTNDKYPVRVKYDLKGPVLRKGASIGANSTILPGVEVGEGSMVAAGALVTRDVPAWKLAIGFPAKVIDMPDELKHFNRI